MEYPEIYKQLKALQVKAFALSKNDKKFIRETSKELNVDFNPRTKCFDCYKDQVIILAIECKKHLNVIDNANCSYKMVAGKNILWRNHVINDETITDELAELFIGNHRNWSKFVEKK